MEGKSIKEMGIYEGVWCLFKICKEKSGEYSRFLSIYKTEEDAYNAKRSEETTDNFAGKCCDFFVMKLLYNGNTKIKF